MRKRNYPIYIFDSWALLAFFKKEPCYQKVETLLRLAEKGKAGLFIPLINWGEIYYITLRNFGSQKAGEIEELIEELPIQIVPITRELVKLAAFQKAKGGLSFADCFVLVVAKKIKAKIITGDPEFKKFEKEIKICWLK